MVNRYIYFFFGGTTELRYVSGLIFEYKAMANTYSREKQWHMENYLYSLVYTSLTSYLGYLYLLKTI